MNNTKHPVIKRIYSALKNTVKPSIILSYCLTSVENLDDLTKEQEVAVKEYFVKQSKALSVVEPAQEMMDKTNDKELVTSSDISGQSTESIEVQQTENGDEEMICDFSNSDALHPTDEELSAIKQHFIADDSVPESVNMMPIESSSCPKIEEQPKIRLLAEVGEKVKGEGVRENKNPLTFPLSPLPNSCKSSIEEETDMEVETTQELERQEHSSPEEITLFTTQNEVKGMVNYKASLMGIQLAASEVDVIASKIDAAGSSFTETLNQIESALISYVDYQQSREASEVDGMLDRVTRRVVEKNQSTINHFTSGINQFKTAMEVAQQHQKRELTSILNRLKVPS
ncbi:hypothetical protein [Brasilonema sp. UFV-L1]|uniref:hypothetical protein n=1 Tax=Brasilonema sp. UFV-L1 TaxID=2234130 RepID=UPI00145DE280|nr:hypothetical protein [Brasilonema sp. UFV-L1]